MPKETKHPQTHRTDPQNSSSAMLFLPTTNAQDPNLLKHTQNQKQDMRPKASETNRNNNPKSKRNVHNSPSTSRLGLLRVPPHRPLEPSTITKFLHLFLVTLALLQLPFGSRLFDHLTRYADLVSAHKPHGMGEGTFVLTETCRAGTFGSAFRAALLAVVEVFWVRHRWREAGVVLGVVL